MVKYMHRKHLHNMKPSRLLPYIAVTVQVEFLHYLEKYERSLLHIFFPCNNQIFFLLMLSKNGCQLRKTWSDTLREQVNATNRLYCGWSIRSFATKFFPAQKSTARLPGRVKLQMMAFIHKMFVYSERSSTLGTNTLEPDRKARLSFGTCGTLYIEIFRL